MAGCAGARLQPIVPVLERIGGQGQGGGGRQQSAPVQRGAPGVQLGERCEQRARIVLVATLGGDPLRRRITVGMVARVGPAERREDSIRPDFHGRGQAMLQQPAQRSGEAYRLAGLFGPVIGRACLLGGQRRTGDGRDDGQGGGVEAEPCQGLAQFGKDAVKVRRMEGMADP